MIRLSLGKVGYPGGLHILHVVMFCVPRGGRRMREGAETVAKTKIGRLGYKREEIEMYLLG